VFHVDSLGCASSGLNFLSSGPCSSRSLFAIHGRTHDSLLECAEMPVQVLMFFALAQANHHFGNKLQQDREASIRQTIFCRAT